MTNLKNFFFLILKENHQNWQNIGKKTPLLKLINLRKKQNKENDLKNKNPLTMEIEWTQNDTK